MSIFTSQGMLVGRTRTPGVLQAGCGWQQYDTTFTSPNLPVTAFWVCLLMPFSLCAHTAVPGLANAGLCTRLVHCRVAQGHTWGLLF